MESYPTRAFTSNRDLLISTLISPHWDHCFRFWAPRRFYFKRDTDKLNHHSGWGAGDLSREDLGHLSLTRAGRGDDVTVLNLYRIVTGHNADMFYTAPEGRAETDKWKQEQVSAQIEENVSNWQNCDSGGLTSAEAKFGRDPGETMLNRPQSQSAQILIVSAVMDN